MPPVAAQPSSILSGSFQFFVSQAPEPPPPAPPGYTLFPIPSEHKREPWVTLDYRRTVKGHVPLQANSIALLPYWLLDPIQHLPAPVLQELVRRQLSSSFYEATTNVLHVFLAPCVDELSPTLEPLLKAFEQALKANGWFAELKFHAVEQPHQSAGLLP